MMQWPNNYDPTPGSAHAQPALPPAQCLASGKLLAKKLISDRSFAAEYLNLVKSHFRLPSDDKTDAYAASIQKADPIVVPGQINEHDFANIHRAAWLTIVRALARLVALNPFFSALNNNQWADPEGVTTHEVALETPHGHFFFRIPSSKGYYALDHSDMDRFEGVPVGQLLPEQPITVRDGDAGAAEPTPSRNEGR